MDTFYEAYLALLVFAALVGLIVFFGVLIRWAKQRKGAALAIGLFVHMFLPDPKVQHTIEFVTESKEQKGQRQPDKPSDQ